MEMNKGLLNLIIMVQNYKQLKLDEGLFYKKGIDWWNETKGYYFNIDMDLMHKLGLNKNLNDFDHVLSYKITDEMENTEYSELGKFTF